MRFVILGAGAIGGTVGVRLHQAGYEVALIARGAHHDAIATQGLTLLTPSEEITAQIPVFATPADAELRDGDVVLLCIKSQDSEAALNDVRNAAPGGRVPIVVMQNGVENERTALRLFPDVYGCVVQMVTEHLEPGLVVCYTSNVTGRLDIGRYPSGTDALTDEICAALAASRFESDARPDVMDHKYAKLINNLVNGVQVVCGPGDPESASQPAGSAPARPAWGPASDQNWNELVKLIQDEGEQVLGAAGINFDAPDVSDGAGRWERWGFADVPGHRYEGGSTWQSVARGAGSVETDFLNGQIVLLGRELGLDVSGNALIQRLTQETLSLGETPGWKSAGEVLAQLRGS